MLLICFSTKPVVRFCSSLVESKYELCEAADEDSTEEDKVDEQDDADELLTEMSCEIICSAGRPVQNDHKVVARFSEFEPGVVPPPPEFATNL